MTTQPHAHVPQWTLADRLRKAREDAGMSRDVLAEELAITVKTVGNAERGDTRPFTLTLRAWAAATGVPFEWLLTGSVAPKDNGRGEPYTSSTDTRPYRCMFGPVSIANLDQSSPELPDKAAA